MTTVPDEGSAETWAERLQPLVGFTARVSRVGSAEHAWTGLNSVDVEIQSLWKVGAVSSQGGVLVVSGRDEDGRSHEERVPIDRAYSGLDGAGTFFLAGWPEGDGHYRYLRISEHDDGLGAREHPLLHLKPRQTGRREPDDER